jgi:hypothetical protein
MRVGAGGKLSLEALVGLAVVESGYVAVPCLDLHQHLRQVSVRGGTADHGDVRSAIENSFAFLLGDATEHAEDFALFLELLVVGEAMEDLLLCLIADGAGVVEDEIGFFDGRDLAVALGYERADDLLGVMHIHLAAESFEVELLVCAVGHCCPSIP